jgi:23S rRNA (guanosine2251-2'-O)-methyltransferase
VTPEPRRGPEVVAGRRVVLELLRAERGAQRILIAQGLAPSSTLGEIRTRATRAGVPVANVPRAQIDRLAQGSNHQGVVAETGRYRYTDLEDLLRPPAPCVLFLDGVMDPHNLGSLLRSADSAGWHGVVLPARRATGVTATVRRTSAGAAEVVPVARVANLAHALDRARAAGLWIVGLDPTAKDSLWTSNLLVPPVALVLGAEDRGISRIVRARCDELVAIPSRGRLDSLNVAMAGAIAMLGTTYGLKPTREPGRPPRRRLRPDQ